MPKFSVIIPLYNKEKEFPSSLQSVLAQNFIDFEIIIVNDGSTDNSLAIAEKEALKNQRIKVFSKKNEGLAATRNFGVNKAIAENVVFIDADDFWYPFHLENLAAILKKFPEAPWFAAAYEKNYNEKLTRKMIAPLNEKNENFIGKVNFFETSLIDSLVHPSSFGMKRDFFLNLGGHNTNITFSEDTDLWIRAALQTQVAFSNKISAVINLNSSNRLNHSAMRTRKYPNFDTYEAEAKNNKALKKYLDVHYFSIALNYKLAGDTKNFKKYSDKIVKENLNTKQKIILKTPANILSASKSIKNFLQKSGIYFSVYK
ncbi:glycosyltransferase family 2 protein [Aequorivita echinoideorum]|uniref:Glycosyltransferase family 2 protein n=1 Tax=Aequorivita echinoideorum TaxID=1549647 RepID=A0ABS5S6L8_9FLAO|nr:glycosyltransferase family 2 protein [Aequorivita echinoideorum]MBT0608842.1 glycosyltransferase family 2 protein [Aequorivita echinoideorum]